MGRKTKSKKITVQDDDDVSSNEEVIPAKKKRSGRESKRDESKNHSSDDESVVKKPAKGGKLSQSTNPSQQSDANSTGSRRSAAKRSSTNVTNGSGYADDSDEDEPAPKKKTKRQVKESKAKDDESEEEEEEEYEVEAIVGTKESKAGRMFRVRWLNHKPKDDTWELEKDLNCQDLVKAFLESKEKKAAPKQTKEESESDTEYEVSHILDVRTTKGKHEFLIRWKNCPKSQNSWEPEDYLSCKDLIDDFMQKKEKDKGIVAKELRVAPKQTDRLTLGASRYRHSRRQDKKARISYHDFLE